MESLGEELILLSIRENGLLSSEGDLDYGLMGSEVLRLAIRGRVDLAAGRVETLDATPTGDENLDAALTSLPVVGQPPTLSSWVRRPRQGILDGYISELVLRGVVRTEPAKVLRLIPITRYDVLEPTPMTDARSRVDEVACNHGPVRFDQAALSSLVWAIGLDRVLYQGRDNRQARKRLGEIATSKANAFTEADALRRVTKAVRTAVGGANSVSGGG